MALNRKLFPEYTLDTIKSVMSLRKPQYRSVQILDTIFQDILLSKDADLIRAREDVHDLYPIFHDFERPFMSMTFALATGVGKTKLMGAFMTYLYTNKGVRNFFVVAPSLTIYDKLKNDLGNPSPDNEKYVFRGVGCFASQTPNVWSDDDYRTRPAHGLTDSDSINIYIFNISKFNSDENKMRSINEYLGESFFDYLKGLDDLVVIMDESHHYRAKASSDAINDLHPVLGLELTATPQVQSGSKTALFKNVVYEYPLSKSIRDGYTRTPYALTRRDVKSYNLNDEELDKTMINDGIFHHENMKTELIQYSKNEGVRLVKPFMLIVCKDTKHAQWVLDYVKSDAFQEGRYKDKVIMVHSNQKGSEKEENVKLLLDVEKADNPIEIVIHVNMLKEGWDVNNLYTIVPLRTATSKTLREQTVGRGLRLPFGKRTGNKMVDSVTITAHDKFDEIIAEAQSDDSIFNAEGIIYADEQKRKEIAQTYLPIDIDDGKKTETIEAAGLDGQNGEIRDAYDEINRVLAQSAAQHKQAVLQGKADKVVRQSILNDARKDLGKMYEENQDVQALIDAMFGSGADETIDQVLRMEMFIPKLKTEKLGEENYIIQDFDLDLTEMSYVPIDNEILVRNMLDSLEEARVYKGRVIDFDTTKPEKYLVDEIREIGEIDYEKCPKIIQKIVLQFLSHYRAKYPEEKVRNICVMYRKDIIAKFKDQLLRHLAVSYKGLVEVVEGINTVVRGAYVDVTGGVRNLYEAPNGANIRSLAYNGAKKALSEPFRFDSDPERLFALCCENSPEVVQWLRPAPDQFNITYNRGHRYEPDFVVETNDMYYLVEVKARNKMSDPDVLAKKERAVSYCEVASTYNLANGHKVFQYLFIPHDEISSSSSFNNLKERFLASNGKTEN